MSYTLKVSETFAAGHHLPDHDGACRNPHGHTWRVEVEATGNEIGADGMIVDFAVIKAALRKILEDYDHAYLNDLKRFKLTPPTAENVAVAILGQLRAVVPLISAVTVWESDTAGVRFER